MDLIAILTGQLRAVERLYDEAAGIFVARKKKIEAAEEPYQPPPFNPEYDAERPTKYLTPQSTPTQLTIVTVEIRPFHALSGKVDFERYRDFATVTPWVRLSARRIKGGLSDSFRKRMPGVAALQPARFALGLRAFFSDNSRPAFFLTQHSPDCSDGEH